MQVIILGVAHACAAREITQGRYKFTSIRTYFCPCPYEKLAKNLPWSISVEKIWKLPQRYDFTCSTGPNLGGCVNGNNDFHNHNHDLHMPHKRGQASLTFFVLKSSRTRPVAAEKAMHSTDTSRNLPPLFGGYYIIVDAVVSISVRPWACCLLTDVGRRVRSDSTRPLFACTNDLKWSSVFACSLDFFLIILALFYFSSRHLLTVHSRKAWPILCMPKWLANDSIACLAQDVRSTLLFQGQPMAWHFLQGRRVVNHARGWELWLWVPYTACTS